MGVGDSSCGRLTVRSFLLKGLVLLIVLWFLLGLMSVLPVNNSPSAQAELTPNGESEILQRIDSALQEINALKRNNAEMKRIIEGGGDREGNSPVLRGGPLGGGGEPSAKYEDTRRQLELTLNEMWYSIRSKKEHLQEIDFEQVKDIYT